MSDVAGAYDDLWGSALSVVPVPGEWARQGRCRSVPASVFFPERSDATSVAEARRLCVGCPVREECLEYALAAPYALQGIWAGTSQKQRSAMRAERALVAAEAEAQRERNTSAAKGSLEAALTALTAHPRRWARVGHYQGRGSAQSTASLLRSGRRAVPPGTWEFEGRRNDLGGSDLYACYLGPAEGAAS